ncbi:hypothetical protein [Streptomyces kronopolitis]|uniref:hypothetical protein n=1 Tax=Streptomyces kronopolitis TaxID=1612435 RepID=UPI0034212FB8
MTAGSSISTALCTHLFSVRAMRLVAVRARNKRGCGSELLRRRPDVNSARLSAWTTSL